MTEKDELQDLWQSHGTTAGGKNVPNFGLLEDMTATMQSPAEMKWLNATALLFAIVRVILEIRRAGSSLEFAACYVAITCAATGIFLLLRQSGRTDLTGVHACSIEEFRTHLAREYDRQTKSFRRSFIPALLLTWSFLLVSGGLRDYSQNGLTAGIAIPPILLLLAIPIGIRFQRTVDQRAVRRILRGC